MSAMIASLGLRPFLFINIMKRTSFPGNLFIWKKSSSLNQKITVQTEEVEEGVL